MPDHHVPTRLDAPSDGDLHALWQRVVGRRAFLKGVGVAGAAALPLAGALSPASAAAQATTDALTAGDVAILRFLTAAELIESDLWEQYQELGGVNGGHAGYVAGLQNLDGDMPQYISDNTDDERSHAAFLNAYLHSQGADEVDLDRFRRLPSSTASGARKKGRLTNLMELNVDTSWYTRYRSGRNPDLGATFPQAVTIPREPAIPLNDTDTPPSVMPSNPPVGAQQNRIQAIANTAGFHFAFIEQGGTSLYTTMALKASSLEALRIIVSIGGVESNHFSLWHDKAGNACAQPLAGVVDPETGVTFPDLNAPHKESLQTNLILPEPTQFLSPDLPVCSVVRPSLDSDAGAVAAVQALTADRLFVGQTPDFFSTLMRLAQAADAAQRQVS